MNQQAFGEGKLVRESLQGERERGGVGAVRKRERGGVEALRERERERRGGCFEKERVKGKFVLRKSSKSLEEMIPYRWRFRLVRFK